MDILSDFSSKVEELLFVVNGKMHFCVTEIRENNPFIKALLKAPSFSRLGFLLNRIHPISEELEAKYVVNGTIKIDRAITFFPNILISCDLTLTFSDNSSVSISFDKSDIIAEIISYFAADESVLEKYIMKVEMTVSYLGTTFFHTEIANVALE